MPAFEWEYEYDKGLFIDRRQQGSLYYIYLYYVN